MAPNHPPNGSSREELVVAHSSDLHLGEGRAANVDRLVAVVAGATAAAADILLLAGDIFDHNRVSLEQLDRVARVFGDAPFPVVVLPGNHDCLVPSSVYRRGGLSEPANVDVLGITTGESLALPDLDLGIWGRPHADYADMSPLSDAPARKSHWHIAVAHGHWVDSPIDFHRSWLIHQEEIDELDADYVALGHWDRATPVGDGRRAVYYSGSPDLARTINVVRLTRDGGVAVHRRPLPAIQPPGAK